MCNKELKTFLYNQDNINVLKNYSIDKKFIFEEVNDNTIMFLGLEILNIINMLMSSYFTTIILY